MTDLLDLLADNDSVAGRLATTAAGVVIAVVFAAAIGRLLIRREDDAYARYYKRKITRYVFAFLAVFEFIWEEITFPIPYRDDWRQAENWIEISGRFLVPVRRLGESRTT